jgi:hypothetical protein
VYLDLEQVQAIRLMGHSKIPNHAVVLMMNRIGSFNRAVTLVAALVFSAGLSACGGSADSTGEDLVDGVFFVSPQHLEVVSDSVHVELGVNGLSVQPAGTVEPGSGHLHILINADFIPAGEVIPADAQHIHLGDGSQARTIALPVGTHTVRAQFADLAHRAYDGDRYRAEVTITVEGDAAFE